MVICVMTKETLAIQWQATRMAAIHRMLPTSANTNKALKGAICSPFSSLEPGRLLAPWWSNQCTCRQECTSKSCHLLLEPARASYMLTQWQQGRPNKQLLGCRRPETHAARHCASQKDYVLSGSHNLDAHNTFVEKGNACMREHTEIIKIKIACLHMLW